MNWVDIEQLIKALTALEVGSEEAIEIENALNYQKVEGPLGRCIRKLVKEEK